MGHDIDRETRQDSRILIVDDDQETCNLLEILLKTRHYQTLVVHNGPDALRCIESLGPDAVVMDVMMPEMDGWEALKRIRRISNVPVLFLTALSSGEFAAWALQSGADDYMRKPYSSQELLARLDALLIRNKPRSNNGKENQAGAGEPRKPVIAAVIPTFNEARFIGSVVVMARKYAQMVIVVDDGSNDATGQVARESGALVLSHPHNMGKGAALSTAFRLLKEQPPDVTVVLDGDGQHCPEELPQVVQPILDNEADIVIGSRYIQPNSRVPRHRKIGHWVFNRLTCLASRVPSTDSQSGYRAFSAKAVKAISFRSNGFSVESEMQFIADENHLKLIEVSIHILYLDKPKRSVIAHGWVVLKGVLQLFAQYRPSIYYALTGSISSLIGFVLIAQLIENSNRTEHLVLGHAFISILLSALGLLMLLTSLTLHFIREFLRHSLNSKSI